MSLRSNPLQWVDELKISLLLMQAARRASRPRRSGCRNKIYFAPNHVEGAILVNLLIEMLEYMRESRAATMDFDLK